MPVFFLYLLKLSIGITLVYLFYRTLLQRLTFYQANRWYLLLYPVLCFIIPMIDVAPLITAGSSTTNSVVNYIPLVQQYAAPAPGGMRTALIAQNGGELITPWVIASGIMLAGMLFFFVRLLIRLASLIRIKKQAVLIDNCDVKLYKVTGNLLPFSFADSIYVNSDAYSPEDLQKIIRHEQVHVSQKHTVDILLGELLCIINWYNPFAWLLRHTMRQNLEFIADNTVVNMGNDKKDYQYLLLKVTGVPVFGVVNQFNFSSLKKRITMMNKIKSAKFHWVKFIFALPLAVLLLLAFRNPLANNNTKTAFKEVFAGLVFDADTHSPLPGVQIRDSLSGKETISDGRGYFEFTYPLKKGSMTIILQLSKQGYKYSLSSIGSYQITEPEKNTYNFLLEGMKNASITGGDMGGSVLGEFEMTGAGGLYSHIEQVADEFFTHTGRWAGLPREVHPERNIKAEWKIFLKNNPGVENVVWSTAKNAGNITIDDINTIKVEKGNEIVTVLLKNGQQSIYNLSKTGEWGRFVQIYKSPPLHNPSAMTETSNPE